MTYTIAIDEVYGIIEISFFDASAHAEHKKARDEVLEICRSRGINKLLIDAQNLKMDASVSTTGLYEFSITWAEMARGFHLKVAAIPPKDHKAKEDARFGDNVAYNRGLKTQTFDDITKARNWLQNLQVE